ncbi:MAG TPA: c-type cytochrome [Planctomycetes bacterium]|nr:c-type cytochrome [Planctomycetota bacterium]
MVWFGIEPAVVQAPQRALQLAKVSKFPKLANYIARRLTAADLLAPVVAAVGEHAIARRALLEGLRDGLQGRRDTQAPANWRAVREQIRGDAAAGQVATELAQLFGDRRASAELLATLADSAADAGARRQALRALAGKQDPALPGRLRALLDDVDLRRDAIRAVADYDDVNLARVLLARYSKFAAEDKLSVVQTLASRPKYGRILTRAIKTGDVQKRDVPAYVARQLRRVVGSGFVEVWGPIDQLSRGKRFAFEKYRALLTDDAVGQANPQNGRAVFTRTCAACHKMYGEGGLIGPDITGSNRADLQYILSNILDPSEEIQDDFKMVIITTRDGRAYAGNIASEDARQVTLRIVGDDKGVVVAKAQIQSRDVVPVSLMPIGLLATLSDAEVLDLIAYLRTTEQVPLQKAR